MSFEYNSSGLRSKKVVGDKTIEYYYSGDLLVAQFDGTTWVRFIYAPNGEAIGFTHGVIDENGQISIDDYCYYVKNAQGDITGFYSMFLSIFREYTYDAWGNITGVYYENGSPVTDPDDVAYLNPLRYRSYYYDDETGLYYLNSRYYNPEWGTFISVDGYVSTGQGLIGYNMYAYCLNNPINYIDPNGTLAILCNCLDRYYFGHTCSAYTSSAFMFNNFHKPTTGSSSMPQGTTGKTSVGSSSSVKTNGVNPFVEIGNNLGSSIVSSYISFCGDEYIKGGLPKLLKTTLGAGAKLIYSLEDFSRSIGIFSFVVTSAEMAWDVEIYQGQPIKQIASVAIDVANVAATVAVNSALTGCSGGLSVVVTVGVSAMIDLVFETIKKAILG